MQAMITYAPRRSLFFKRLMGKTGSLAHHVSVAKKSPRSTAPLANMARMIGCPQGSLTPPICSGSMNMRTAAPSSRAPAKSILSKRLLLRPSEVSSSSGPVLLVFGITKMQATTAAANKGVWPRKDLIQISEGNMLPARQRDLTISSLPGQLAGHQLDRPGFSLSLRQH